MLLQIGCHIYVYIHLLNTPHERYTHSPNPLINALHINILHLTPSYSEVCWNDIKLKIAAQMNVYNDANNRNGII